MYHFPLYFVILTFININNINQGFTMMDPNLQSNKYRRMKQTKNEP
jgi:hypothetical protein